MAKPHATSGSRFSDLGLTLVERAFSRCPPFVGWRVMAYLLRAAGLRLGKSSVFWGMPSFSGGGRVSSLLSIGEHCGFNLGCHFEVDDQIVIEDHVSVGHQVMFLTRRKVGGGTAPIRIGAGAWLGSRCVVMPGVTVGAGAVVGAAAVITEDIPPNVLFSGGRKISLAKWR